MTDLILLTKLEKLDAYSHQALNQFPKYEKHVLSSTIRLCIAGLIKMTIACSKKYYKKNTLQDMDVEVEYLRTLIRKSYSLNPPPRRILHPRDQGGVSRGFSPDF